MPKKNQSKSNKKVFHVKNQKKPLQEADPNLIQIARKFYKNSEWVKSKKSDVTKSKKSDVTKSKGSEGIKRRKQ